MMPLRATHFWKLAVFCHRWLGVAFCVLFAWWFVSGIFMMYWDYPGVSAEDRLARAAPLDGSRIRLSPAEAFARLESSYPPDRVRIATFDGRPAYWFEEGFGEAIVYADNGERQDEFGPEMNLRTAAAWTGQPAGSAKLEILREPDQWTVAGSFDDLRPLRKYSWPDGQQAYVSEATGQVVQYTTRASRLGAYLGAIPHWLYFTPLRTHPALWSKIVIWASGIATVVAFLGLVAGVMRYSPSRRYRFRGAATAIPYTGQKRLHMILGLFAGVTACTWAFSGMLSMDPFPVRAEGRTAAGAARISRALRGGKLSMDAFQVKSPSEALAQLPRDFRVVQLELTSFVGDPVYVASGGPERSLVVPLRGDPVEAFGQRQMIDAAAAANRPFHAVEARPVNQYDAYYRDRLRRRPLPVLLVRFDDPENSRYYIDPRTAVVVGRYGKGAWMTRWLYHALHSLDFPWLYNYRPLWDVVTLALLMGGAALSVTSIIIAWRLVASRAAKRGRTAVLLGSEERR